jgi:flavin-dependent dehydrogenase
MRWDVVVVGGGPAGAAAAGILAAGGAKVALFDSASRAEPRWGEAGPPRLRDVLVRQGLWHSFLEEDYPKVSGVTSFWGGTDAGETDFLFQPPGHGWHVVRGRFDSWLRRRAEVSGASVYSGWQVQAIGRKDGSWSIRCQDSREFVSEWVIDACGRSTPLKLGLSRRRFDRLVAILRTGENQNRATFERPLIESAASGWWYSISSPDGRLHVYHFTDGDLLRQSRRSVGWWDECLAEAPRTRDRILSCATLSAPTVLAAHTSLRESPIDGHLLRVGDAAMTVDPLCSQGLCFALESAEDAAATILKGSARPMEIIADYQARIAARFRSYWDDYHYFYGQENRFLDLPFWRRRRDPDRS